MNLRDRRIQAVAAGGATLVLLLVILLATRGGGSSSGPPPPSEGIAGRSPVPLAGLASPVAVGGSCIASSVLETVGRDSKGRPQPLLTLTLRSDPADEAALAAVLAAPDCSAERQRLVSGAVASLPKDGVGALLVDYRTASGARLRVP